MSGAVSALYEVLIERDLGAIPAATSRFLEHQTPHELWTAVTRFAVLAFAPSLHSKRALVACRVAGELRGDDGGRWIELLSECARYTAESRPAWSEPPPSDPPPFDGSAERDDLASVIAAGDRLRAERWLAAREDEAPAELRRSARGETLLLLDAALALEGQLGEKGRFSLLRTVVWDMVSNPDEAEVGGASLAALVEDVVQTRGAIESVSALFVAEARGRLMSDSWNPLPPSASAKRPFPVYRLARDFGQALIARSVASHLSPAESDRLLAAVDDNLEHGDSFADWSLA